MCTKKPNTTELCFLWYLLLLQGCIYIPTPEHDWSRQLVNPADVASFTPGKTNREEVLLMLGDPSQREEQDRYFFYFWERTQGYYVIHPGISLFVAMGGGLIPPVIPTGKKHILAIEFREDDVIKRLTLIDPTYFEDPDKRLGEWQREKQ